MWVTIHTCIIFKRAHAVLKRLNKPIQPATWYILQLQVENTVGAIIKTSPFTITISVYWIQVHGDRSRTSAAINVTGAAGYFHHHHYRSTVRSILATKCVNKTDIYCEFYSRRPRDQQCEAFYHWFVYMCTSGVYRNLSGTELRAPKARGSRSLRRQGSGVQKGVPLPANIFVFLK